MEYSPLLHWCHVLALRLLYMHATATAPAAHFTYICNDEHAFVFADTVKAPNKPQFIFDAHQICSNMDLWPTF